MRIAPVPYYCALAVVATLPLAFVCGHSVLGWVGDSHYFIWLIDWVYQSLFHLHQSPFWVPYLNYPDGVSLFCNEWTPANIAMALPFRGVAGGAFACNAVVLLTFVLSGWAMHAWVRRITACTAAAYVAGTLFAISPYRMIRTLGHLNLLATQWLPLYFMCLTAMLDSCGRRGEEESRPATRPYRSAAMAGVLLGVLALSTAYYLYMTAVISVFYVACYALFVQREFVRTARFWRSAALLIATLAIPAAIAVGPYVWLARSGQAQPRSAADANRYNASPEHFLLPSWQHFLWGPAVERAVYPNRPIENIQYLGAVALALAAAGVIGCRRAGGRGTGVADGQNSSIGRLVPVLACTAGVAIVLALGNRLHVGGKEVRLALPEFLRSVAGGDSMPLPLPGLVLFKCLPYYDMMRVWMRYGLYANLFLCVLAGIGTACLLSRMKETARRSVAMLLVGLALLDFMPGHRFVFRIEPREVDRWLAAHGGPGSWMQYPFEEAYRCDVNYNAAASGHPTVSGYFSFSPPRWRGNAHVLATFPGGQSIDRLRSVGCRYVVIHSLRLPDWDAFRAAMESAGLVHLHSSGTNHVYELPGAPASAR